MRYRCWRESRYWAICFRTVTTPPRKTELVIFLRPVVIKDADLNGDFSAYRNKLPDQDFFKESASGKP